jgi:hypothetical protein
MPLLSRMQATEDSKVQASSNMELPFEPAEGACVYHRDVCNR